jgi:hypothetical protein
LYVRHASSDVPSKRLRQAVLEDCARSVAPLVELSDSARSASPTDVKMDFMSGRYIMTTAERGAS